MSLLKRTNQLWKLYLFAASMALGAGITLSQSFLNRLFDKNTIISLVIAGMILVISAFCWAYTSITCQNCKLKIFWHSIIKEGLGRWFVWLINLEKCPECGSLDGLPVPSRPSGKSRSKNLK